MSRHVTCLDFFLSSSISTYLFSIDLVRALGVDCAGKLLIAHTENLSQRCKLQFKQRTLTLRIKMIVLF